MEPLTAIMAAAFRAIGSKNPDVEFRNPDHLAIKLLRPMDIDRLADAGMDFRPLLKLEGAELSRYLLGAAGVTNNVVRTKHVDASMIDALEHGARQVVVMGAGLDSRAYRFETRLGGVQFFEVDCSAALEFKKQRVMTLLERLPSHVRYVTADFTKDDVFTELLASGYDEHQCTCFIVEGVFHYIREENVRAILRLVAEHSGNGSEIIFDYALLTNPKINNPSTRMARWGAPYVFGFPSGGPVRLIRDVGLEVVSDLRASELTKLYATRSDGSSSLRLPELSDDTDSDDAGLAIARRPGK
jgi:methyltransferase (TIGR00027 family)